MDLSEHVVAATHRAFARWIAHPRAGTGLFVSYAALPCTSEKVLRNIARSRPGDDLPDRGERARPAGPRGLTIRPSARQRASRKAIRGETGEANSVRPAVDVRGATVRRRSTRPDAVRERRRRRGNLGANPDRNREVERASGDLTETAAPCTRLYLLHEAGRRWRPMKACNRTASLVRRKARGTAPRALFSGVGMALSATEAARFQPRERRQGLARYEQSPGT